MSTPSLVTELPNPWDADAFLSVFQNWVSKRGLTLYPAQEEAILELALGNHLVLSTPTGTGKSLVAVAEHAIALTQGKRSYYTAPIKALVSEKFFELVAIFGPERVGMLTGDSKVNPDAPIICCTAEILANTVLRQGNTAAIDSVVMDEFHFYADPERGWAWQVPLLQLRRARFLLMSATLGDVSAIATDLQARTAREVARVTGVERPIPLNYRYLITPIQETVETLLADSLSPIYLVHFTQAAAVESAQSLASVRVASREQRNKIAEALGAFRFASGFGKTLSRLVRSGIGVHHAGMLPRYRRLVEQLTQQGLLRVVCGTDTLGVGINVPIRTVLFTGLSKFDGTRMRQLTAREFHQIAGRAGRAGFDTAGEVVALAPPHEIENAKAFAKAGGDLKAQRKVTKKRAPDGFVNWGEASFHRLITAEPEALASAMRVSAAMLVQLFSRPGADKPANMPESSFQNVRALVQDNHEPPERRTALTRRAIALYRTLRTAGVVEQTGGGFTGTASLKLTLDLQEDFALNQPLSPFALAALELLDPESPEYFLDAVSVIETTLDNPRPVLVQQLSRAKGEAVAAMKADGVGFEERMELLEQLSWPKPLEDLLEQAYETFALSQPWVKDFELQPKSVVRDLYEKAMNFSDYISYYQLARSEGLVLRYLSEAYRALKQTIPDETKNEQLHELIDWLGELVRQVDSSLLDEWAKLINPTATQETSKNAVRPSAPQNILSNRRAFMVLLRNELWRRVQWAALENDEQLLALDPDAEWTKALDAYYAEHDTIGTGADARSATRVIIQEGENFWQVRQIFSDPSEHHDWGFDAQVDLVASRAEGAPVIRVLRVNRL